MFRKFMHDEENEARLSLITIVTKETKLSKSLRFETRKFFFSKDVRAKRKKVELSEKNDLNSINFSL